MKTGVIYLVGRPFATRFIVSLWSLRAAGNKLPVTLFSLPSMHDLGNVIADDARLDLDHRPIRPIRDDYLGTLATKTLLPAFTPYEVSLFIDADTVVTSELNQLVATAESKSLVLTRFGNETCGAAGIQQKCDQWRSIGADVARRADGVHGDAPAINTGVFCFRRGFAKLADWTWLAMRGMDSPVPDEMAMQLLWPELDSKDVILLDDDRWNRSPLVGVSENAAIWHFHNNSHLRTSVGQELWWPVLKDVIENDVGNISQWGP